MRKKILIVLLFLIIPYFLFSTKIASVEIKGNERVSKQTIKYYFDISEGDEFFLSRINRNIKRLWDTGFFRYIEVKKEETVSGGVKIILFVEEKPVINKIEYITKGIGEDKIKNHLSEEGLELQTYSYYDPYKMNAIKETIETFLQEKNYDNSEVKIESEQKDKEVSVKIIVDKGMSIKINDIDFKGNETISSLSLKWKLKTQREHSLIFSIFSKDKFSREKLQEGLENLKKAYYNQGFLEVNIGEPKFEYVQKRDIFFKKRKMVNITIPIEENDRYKIGTIDVEGNKILPDEVVKAILGLNKNDWYSLKKRNDGIQEIQKAYGNRGYFYCQVAPVENLDPAGKQVNLEINIQENDKAYLRYLKFKGNTFTKDFVLRREFFMREGDVFRTILFENSLRRLKQLGLVDIKEMPEVEPDPKDPSKIDVTINVEEVGRNMIQFSGGYSGYEGTFIMLGYSTKNFMGAGEKLELMLRYGSRMKNYTFGFTEPYVFNKPISLGFQLFDQSMEYYNYFDRATKGARLFLNTRLLRYTHLNLTYSYEKIKVNNVSPLFSYTNPYYAMYYQKGERTFSSIIPNIYYSTIDSPIDPTTGIMYGLSLKYSAKMLGSDVSFIKPHFSFTKYFDGLSRRHTFGIHFEGSFIHLLSDDELPFYEGFYMGGERSIRGYNVYSIVPRDEDGYITVAHKLLQLNAEYKIPLGKDSPIDLILFGDAGNVWGKEVPPSLRDLYTSFGAEFRVFIPALNVPFRLIFAYNPKLLSESDKHFQMRFGVGPTF